MDDDDIREFIFAAMFGGRGSPFGFFGGSFGGGGFGGGGRRGEPVRIYFGDGMRGGGGGGGGYSRGYYEPRKMTTPPSPPRPKPTLTFKPPNNPEIKHGFHKSFFYNRFDNSSCGFYVSYQLLFETINEVCVNDDVRGGFDIIVFFSFFFLIMHYLSFTLFLSINEYICRVN